MIGTHRTRRLLPAMLAGAALMGVALTGAAVPARAGNIVITYTDSPGEGFLDPTLGAARRNAIEAAAANWAGRLEIGVDIQVSASMDPMGGNAYSAILGGAAPRYGLTLDAPSAKPGVHYVIALANQIEGEDLATTATVPAGWKTDDILIQYNSDVDGPTVLGPSRFYYGTDGVVTSSPGEGGYLYPNIDFYQTCLHEIGHGLGFFDGLDETGAYFYDGKPFIMDTFLVNASGQAVTGMATEAERLTALTSNALYFGGPAATAANAGQRPRIYAPGSYAVGSSTSHLDESTFSSPWLSGQTPNGGINELMTPMLGPGNMHHLGPIVAGALIDMGWKFKPYTFADVASALRSVAGLRPTTDRDLVRLQRQELSRYPGRLLLPDVILNARAASGADPNPQLYGTP